MSSLTSKQRAHLRSLAHHLKPVAHIGAAGITDQAVRSVEETFHTRELIKVKVLEAAPVDVQAAAAALSEALDGVEVVQTIGRTAVLYRPDPDDPEIRLP